MRKRKLLSVLLLTAALVGAIALGCVDTNDSASTERTPGKKTNTMKIRIKLDNKTLTATLADNATSADFVSLLPLTLTLKNYASTEKIGDLPKQLSTEGAPAGCDPDVGDIAYYAPWGNLAIFYKDSSNGYARGLIKLGKIDEDVGALNTTDDLKTTIELIK
ncbi:MAG: cyclophilin-like fold protein [Nostoc sp.]|uniref:cyclophilin-like fold protein n=1 Tax=Nostoc sp. TaxID=1180 RepID=UPI002FF8A55D